MIKNNLIVNTGTADNIIYDNINLSNILIIFVVYKYTKSAFCKQSLMIKAFQMLKHINPI